MKQRKPVNILWLMSDQHNANCMSCAGHPDVRTPALDSIAEEGTLFTRAYCNNPVCGPSRSTLLTGQYPHTHGITGNDLFDYEATTPPNVAAHFRQNGYQTAMIGKGHLPKAWMEDGFEYLRYCDLADAERDDPRTCHYFNYLVEQGLADKFDLGSLPEDHPGGRLHAFTSEIPLKHSVEVWTGNETLDFLKNRDESRPFFLKVSFERPHDPFGISPETVDMYDPDKLTLPANYREFFDGFPGKPQFQQDYVREGVMHYPYRPTDEADLRRQLQHYLTLVSVIDGEVGRIIAHLKETGEWENTMVVYLADHGDFAGEHGLCLKNLGIYESIHRIPFIMKWPAGPKGETDALVETVDLAPTLCAAAGIPALQGGEGRDVRPVAEGREPGMEHTICEWDFPNPNMRTVFAVRSQTHRLVHYLAHPDDGELYDVVADPGEMQNLWNDPEHLATREKLLRQLLGHVGLFRRNYTFWQDRSKSANNPTSMVHKRHYKWSEVERLMQ